MGGVILSIAPTIAVGLGQPTQTPCVSGLAPTFVPQSVTQPPTVTAAPVVSVPCATATRTLIASPGTRIPLNLVTAARTATRTPTVLSKSLNVLDDPTETPTATLTAAPLPSENVAVGKTATQSSTLSNNYNPIADKAIDGNIDGVFVDSSVSTTNNELITWWQVDLGNVYPISSINIWNRADCCAERLSDFYVFVSDTPFSSTDPSATIAQSGVWVYHVPGQGGFPTSVTVNQTGQYVRIQLAGQNYLSLAEVQVFAGSSPLPFLSGNMALGRIAQQSSTLLNTYSPIAGKAVDGNTDGIFVNSSVSTTNNELAPWWQVDLSAVRFI